MYWCLVTAGVAVMVWVCIVIITVGVIDICCCCGCRCLLFSSQNTHHKFIWFNGRWLLATHSPWLLQLSSLWLSLFCVFHIQPSVLLRHRIGEYLRMERCFIQLVTTKWIWTAKPTWYMNWESPWWHAIIPARKQLMLFRIFAHKLGLDRKLLIPSKLFCGHVISE